MRRVVPLLLLAGCVAEPGPPEPGVTPESTPIPTVIPDAFELGEEVVCDAPHEGPDRFVDEAALRGLDWDQDNHPEPDPVGDGVVAVDVDDDGDPDLLMGGFPSFPRVLLNDGGSFAEAGHEPPELPFPKRMRWSYWAAVDLDGDRLPELLGYDNGWAAYAPNLGGGAFGDVVLIHDDTEAPIPQFQTVALGDPDGDHDLDLLLPVVHEVGTQTGEGGDAEAFWEPHVDLLFRNEGDGFELVAELMPEDEPGYAQVATFTDRDGDGDQDLLIPSEFGGNAGVPPTAFFRNDGVDALGRVTFVNDAPQRGADLPVGGMGVDSSDLNGDGRLDYCVSNTGPLMCLLSEGDGWVEGAGVLGTQRPPHPFDPSQQDYLWSSYSVDFADFDADGHVELAVSAGPPSRDHDDRSHVDGLWWGGTEGFAEVGTEIGWTDPRRHFGQATLDVDGDGFLDVVIAGSEGPPVLWMNRCSAGAWLLLTFEGLGTNVEGHGVQVEATVGDRTWIREVMNMRAIGQGPPQLHFGFGAVDSVDRLLVRWPDGVEQEATGVPVRRRVVVSHPDR